ncbi:unnamed protein product, partial [marine sediment metagenome]
CGFLYLYILGTNAASVGLGNRMDEKKENAVKKLRIINDNPNRYRQSLIIAIISHLGIIAIAVTLFLAFNQYNPLLAIIGTIFRLGEGSILSYNEIKSFSHLNIAKEYSNSSDSKQITLSNSCGTLIQKSNFRFILGLNFLSIGTLSYCILFLSTGAIFIPIGWLGFVASAISVIGTGIVLIKPNFNILYKIGLPLMMLFEITFGIWLLFFLS